MKWKISKTNVMLIVLAAALVVSNVISFIRIGGKVSSSDVKDIEERYEKMEMELVGRLNEIDNAWRAWGADVERWQGRMDSLGIVLEEKVMRRESLEDWFNRNKK